MSSVFRSLRSIFTTKPSASATLKPTTNPKPTTTATSKSKKITKTPKYSRPVSSKPEDLKTEVARFKKLCGTRRFRDHARPFEDLVRRLAVAGQCSYIEEIIEHQKIYEATIKRENFVVRLIGLYGKANMFEHAQKLFDEMPRLNCDRTVLSFNALLTACVNSKKYDKLGELFGELPEKLSIEPDTVSYNIIVKGFVDRGSVDSAIEVIGEMKKDGREPDIITYNTIIHALHQEKRLAEAEKIWERMVSNNIVPNTRSYNSKLRGLCADKRVSEAVDLFREMERKGVKTDIYTCNAMLHGFSEDRNLVEVKKWYGEIRKNDLLPDRVTFSMVVPFACDAGDFGFAHELSKEMIAIKGLVTKEILQRVVDGLVKELEMDKAEELVELVNSSNHVHFKLQLPTDVFKGLMRGSGHVMKSMHCNAKATLELFEASSFAIEGENILEEAADFASTEILRSNSSNINDKCAKKLGRALELPLQRRVEWYHVKRNIQNYEKQDVKNPLILKLAKLNFNRIQATHQKDLKDIQTLTFTLLV